jgi:hypothetical protein
MTLSSDQITAIIAFIVALTALAGAITNYLQHNTNAARIDALHTRVDAVSAAQVAPTQPTVVVVPSAAAPASGLVDGHSQPVPPAPRVGDLS